VRKQEAGGSGAGRDERGEGEDAAIAHCRKRREAGSPAGGAGQRSFGG
jgi:hypothetical protein